MTVHLRAGRSSDEERLLEIQREASLAALSDIFPPDRYPFPDDDVRERWRRLLADATTEVLVAERGGAILGMAAFAPQHLVALYVIPDEWGGGVGSRLHDDAVAGLRELGDEARLWVLVDNLRARTFYERRGWQLDGRERVVPFPPHPLDVGYTRTLR